jgi:hypothetical protein
MVQVAENIEQSEREELLNLNEIYHALNAAAAANNIKDAALLAIQAAIVTLHEEGAPRSDVVDIISQVLLYASDDFDMSGIAEILRAFPPITRAAELSLIQHLASLPEEEFWRVEKLELRLKGLGFYLKITSTALELVLLEVE